MWEAIVVIFFIISAIYRAIKNSRTKTPVNTPDSAEVQRRRQEAYERAQREYAARAAQAQGTVPPGTTGAVTPVVMTTPARPAAVKAAVAVPAASGRAALPGRAPAPARAPLPGATRGQSAASVAPKQSARPPQASPRRTIAAPNASTPLDSSGDESFRRNVRDLENSEARALNIPLTDTPADALAASGLAALQQRLAQNNPQTASLISALILSQALGAPRGHGRAGGKSSPHPLA